MPGYRAIIVGNALWNDTGIDLAAGARYRMTAIGSWHDRQFRSGPDGVTPQNILQRIFSPLLRFPNGHYMTLIACIDQDMGSAFAIGTNANYKATRNGRLWCFANDVRFLIGAYGNNSGAIELIVDRNYRTTGPDGLTLYPTSIMPSTLSKESQLSSECAV